MCSGFMEKAAVGAGGYILLLVYAGVRCHPAARLVRTRCALASAVQSSHNKIAWSAPFLPGSPLTLTTTSLFVVRSLKVLCEARQVLKVMVASDTTHFLQRHVDRRTIFVVMQGD